MEALSDRTIFTNAIDLGHSLIQLRSDGIVEVNFGDDVELDLKESIEICEAIGKITGGEKKLILNIGGKNTSATSAARDHSASAAGAKFTIADAFVTKSLAQKLMGNFYMNFHKPIVPTRMFDDVDKATEWLKGRL
jgi:hypothetical protein